MTANDTATFHEVVLRPREPIIARDGRPFAATPGARAMSLPWPLPSTLAGALRTRIGTDLNFDWRSDGPDRARRIAVQGPLMLARWRQDDAWQVYLPQPHDALIVKSETGQATMHALRPFAPDEGAGCDLPHAGLRPLRVPESGKALTDYAYWPLSAYTRWLSEATPGSQPAPARCLESPPHETRVHVAMNRDTRTGAEGALFSTVGLAFADQPQPAHPGETGEQPLPRRGKAGEQPARAMLCRAAGADARTWTAATSYLPLGGERRLVELRPIEGTSSLWPACPPKLRAALRDTRRLRLALVTPAIFAGGWRPGWLDDLEGAPPEAPSLRLRLVAAAVGRREPVSGWDLQKKQAKAARYMAPAGSVYFFEIVAGALDDEQIDRLWLHALSDAAQDRADGFGLTVIGVW